MKNGEAISSTETRQIWCGSAHLEVLIEQSSNKRQRSGYKKESSIGDEAPAIVGYGFINETIESISQCPSNRYMTPSSRSMSVVQVVA